MSEDKETIMPDELFMIVGYGGPKRGQVYSENGFVDVVYMKFIGEFGSPLPNKEIIMVITPEFYRRFRKEVSPYEALDSM